MKILVTGGAGYIGSHTSVELLKNGYDIVVVDNFCNADRNVIQSIKTISGKDFKHYECDLLNAAELDKVFDENEFDAVIHFAGLKSVPESVSKALQYYENNITGTLHLLESMKKHGVTKIVFSSSATVYGNNNKVPYNEDMPTSATNPYGWTKVMIEQILRDFAVSDPKAQIAILRYFNPIGADKSGLIGDNPEGIPNNLMPYICQAAVGKLPFLRVFGTDFPTVDGTGIRDYIHVVDLADGHLKALEKLTTTKGVITYNLGTGKGTSVLELVDTFEKVSGITIKRVIYDRRPGDIAESYAEVDKAEKELGWTAKLTVEDMCRDCWGYISKNRS